MNSISVMPQSIEGPVPVFSTTSTTSSSSPASTITSSELQCSQSTVLPASNQPSPAHVPPQLPCTSTSHVDIIDMTDDGSISTISSPSQPGCVPTVTVAPTRFPTQPSVSSATNSVNLSAGTITNNSFVDSIDSSTTPCDTSITSSSTSTFNTFNTTTTTNTNSSTITISIPTKFLTDSIGFFTDAKERIAGTTTFLRSHSFQLCGGTKAVAGTAKEAEQLIVTECVPTITGTTNITVNCSTTIANALSATYPFTATVVNSSTATVSQSASTPRQVTLQGIVAPVYHTYSDVEVLNYFQSLLPPDLHDHISVESTKNAGTSKCRIIKITHYGILFYLPSIPPVGLCKNIYWTVNLYRTSTSACFKCGVSGHYARQCNHSGTPLICPRCRVQSPDHNLKECNSSNTINRVPMTLCSNGVLDDRVLEIALKPFRKTVATSGYRLSATSNIVSISSPPTTSISPVATNNIKQKKKSYSSVVNATNVPPVLVVGTNDNGHRPTSSNGSSPQLSAASGSTISTGVSKAEVESIISTVTSSITNAVTNTVMSLMQQQQQRIDQLLAAMLQQMQIMGSMVHDCTTQLKMNQLMFQNIPSSNVTPPITPTSNTASSTTTAASTPSSSGVSPPLPDSIPSIDAAAAAAAATGTGTAPSTLNVNLTNDSGDNWFTIGPRRNRRRTRSSAIASPPAVDDTIHATGNQRKKKPKSDTNTGTTSKNKKNSNQISTGTSRTNTDTGSDSDTGTTTIM